MRTKTSDYYRRDAPMTADERRRLLNTPITVGILATTHHAISYRGSGHLDCENPGWEHLDGLGSRHGRRRMKIGGTS